MRRNVFIRTALLLLLPATFHIACTPSLYSYTTPTNLLGRIDNDTRLSAFSNLLSRSSKVGKLLGGKTKYTILAPTNEAIADMGQDAIARFTGSKEGLKELGNVLKNHIARDIKNPADSASGTLVNLRGDTLNTSQLEFIGEPIIADNGIIQVVTKVIR